MSKVLSCLICDVARKEVGQKGILVGVYSGAIVGTEMPLTIPTFALWLEIKPSKKKLNINLEVVSPEKKTLCKLKGNVELSDIKHPGGIPIQFGAITFPVEGAYKIKIGFDGKPAFERDFFVAKAVPPKQIE